VPARDVFGEISKGPRSKSSDYWPWQEVLSEIAWLSIQEICEQPARGVATQPGVEV
jgi:hypothetical protein